MKNGMRIKKQKEKSINFMQQAATWTSQEADWEQVTVIGAITKEEKSHKDEK